jgi:hypothetical protein
VCMLRYDEGTLKECMVDGLQSVTYSIPLWGWVLMMLATVRQSPIWTHVEHACVAHDEKRCVVASVGSSNEVTEEEALLMGSVFLCPGLCTLLVDKTESGLHGHIMTERCSRHGC